MKLLQSIKKNPLLAIVVFLLAFIPLYPKLPLLDIQHTWVYIRVEDFLIAGSVLIFFILWIKKRATLKTPLTVPIITYWVVGLVATVYGVLFIFPTITNVYPTVAGLHYLRYIEYIIVFFIGYSAIRDKQSLKPVIIVLVITLVLVVLYGWGQKGFLVTSWENRFPAFSTMNEEFAKGIPLRISELGRVSSTFAGHYDLAAYLVLLIALVGSLIFGVKRIWLKMMLLVISAGSLILLMMTASRVSFAVYLVTIIFMLIIQKQKKYIVPVIIASIILLQFFQGLQTRFASTISQVDVVVDARTGKPIGVATTDETGKTIVEEKELTGENLPQGSGFINLPGEDGAKTGELVYKRTKLKDGGYTTEVTDYQGDFVVRKALAYDVSFTTRFQGQWPRAIEAFKRNILLGSGFSSISLATDNNYLRILGETGILGFASFAMIFIVFGIYIYRVLPYVDRKLDRSFTLGVVAGLFGVGLNAVLIDVFVASKVAFVMWLLIGVTLGVLALYEKKKLNMLDELKKFFLSIPALVAYFLGATVMIFSMILPNFFAGDDFTWLRWAADCKRLGSHDLDTCVSVSQKVVSFFTDSDGFFYRPGTKLYFTVMYAVFWLHQAIYHFVSIFMHFLSTASVLILTYKFVKNKWYAVFSATLFLTLSAHFESIFWVSVTGHLIASTAILVGTVCYVYWRDTRNYVLLLLAFVSAIVAPLFHEFGIVAPFIFVSYSFLFSKKSLKHRLTENWIIHSLFLLLVPLYLFMRYSANSHWQGGDYSYNLIKLPFNAIGNFVGYIGIMVSGTRFMPMYEMVRTQSRENYLYPIVGLIILMGIGYVLWRQRSKIVSIKKKKTVLFGLVFFTITLLPFLGLGNITYRYIYLPSAGLAISLAALGVSYHETLSKQSKKIMLIIVGAVVGLYSIFQITELNRINKDWQEAGRITSGFVNDVTEYYETSQPRPKNPVYYFSNIPMMTGTAWIFTVGAVEDALWFPFQGQNLTVKTVDDIEEARKMYEYLPNTRFFEFDEVGDITLIRKEFEYINEQ